MKKVISLILALTMLVSSMAITANATDDQTITLDGDIVETSVISCAGTLTIEGKGSLTCPGINANMVIFNSGYIQIDGQLIAETITLDGAVINVNTSAETAIDGNIVANAGVMIANTSSKSSNVNVFDTSNSITINNSMHYWIENKVLNQKDIATTDLKKGSVNQIIIAKKILYAIDNAITQDEFDSTYVYMHDNFSPLSPTTSTFITSGNLFYAVKNPGIKIGESISGSGTIVGYSKSGEIGLKLLDNSYVNDNFCLISHGTSGTNTIFPNSSNPPHPTSPTNKDFTLVGEIVNQTKNSVTIAYKIVKNEGVCGVVLKPIFSGQNIDVFIDKNALGNDWSDIVSSSNCIYELSSANQSTQTGTNLALITYTNIKTNDTFGLEVTYAPDDSGTFTTSTNNINIQALSHQAVFHFMYKDTEIKRVTHTNVEVETTLTDLGELINNIQWFKQTGWYSDIDCTFPINYMPNNDIDVYCNYLFDVKVGNIDGDNTVTANDLLLLRKYIVSDTDNYIFIKNEDDAFNESKSYNLSKNYVFLCNANVNKVNNPTNNDIDEADVVALSQAISKIQSYKYKLNDDSTMVISRK